MVVRLRGFSDYLLAIPLALPGALANRALVTGIPRRLGVDTGPRPKDHPRFSQRPYKPLPRSGSPAARGGTPGVGRNCRGAGPPPGASQCASNRIISIKQL